jgi:uncharacterized protein YecT (DUF1311 family)
MIALLLCCTSGSAEVLDEYGCLRINPNIVSPVEMAECTSDLSGSEESLADALRNLSSKVPATYRPMLENAQTAWKEFRDSECVWEAGGGQGSTGNSAAIIACTADMNRARSEALKADLKDRW